MEPSPPGDEYLDSPIKKCHPVAPMDIWQCTVCGHAQLRCIYDPKVLYGSFLYETQISSGLDRHFEEYATEACEVANLHPGDLVFDIGSNDGTLLSKFKKKGIQVHGVDPAIQAAQKAIAKGIPTTIDFLSENLAENLLQEVGKPKLITTNNTFANIDDLHSFIKAIQHLMIGDATFCLETGYGHWIANKGLFETIYHEHLGYFSLHDLLGLMHRHGLSLRQVNLNCSKGGCLRAYFQKGPSGNPSQTFNKILSDEKESDYFQGRAWEQLAEKIANKRQELSKTIDQYGPKIGSFGASVSTTTFLLNLGLAEVIDCLFDENPLKIGKFSPIGNKPVFAVSRDMAGCSSMIINAWRYEEEIVQKHKPADSKVKWISVWPGQNRYR